MRVPVSWLNSMLRAAAPDLSAEMFATEALAAALIRLGFEVEELTRVAPGLETVFTGRILAADPHPNADKLRVCQTDLGTGDPLQIVTGATNVQVGDVVPLARVGSLLPGGKAINAAKLRGIESFGMYCSLQELGLPPGIDGVHVLPSDTPLGLPIAEVMGLGEEVLVLAVTANRPDALSIIGVAREILADRGRTVAYLPGAPAEALARAGSGETPCEVELEAGDRCPRYTAQIIRGVTVGPSPDWLRKRLEAGGIRSINNVVDVTNYVLLEWGQPLHAFDLGGLEGPVSARLARSGERIRTLDGQDRELPDGTLVIADAREARAVAGVMGGEAAEVSTGTTDVLLESAYFAPSGIRRTAKQLGLASESSYRFERGVDPVNVAEAGRYAARLIAGIAGGTVIGEGIDARISPGWPALPVVPYRSERRHLLLGSTPENEPDDEALLTRLGFEVVDRQDGSVRFLVPGWRYHDVTREVDLVEEVARAFGYDRFAEEPLPQLRPRPADRRRELLTDIRRILTGAGLAEASTSSLVSASSVEGIDHPGDLVTLARPLADMGAMRPVLLASLLEIASHNVHQGLHAGGGFEVARVYQLGAGSGERPVEEPLHLAGIVWGEVATGLWKEAPAGLHADYAWGKGLLERLFEALHVEGIAFVPASPAAGWHTGQSAELRLDGRPLGRVGRLHPALASAHDLDVVVAFELDLEPLLGGVPGQALQFRPFSRFPAVARDLALTLREDVLAGAVVRAAQEAGGELLEEVRPFDRYQGPQVPAGHVSLGLSLTYRAGDRTLTEAELDPVHRRVVETLERQFGAQLRA